jgi:hypothetical protein
MYSRQKGLARRAAALAAPLIAAGGLFSAFDESTAGGSAPHRLDASPVLAQPEAMRLPSGPSCASIPITGDVVHVTTARELASAVANLATGQTVLLAAGRYELENTIHLRGGLTGIAIRGATGDPTDVELVGPGMSNPDHGPVPHGILVSDAMEVLIADLTIRDVYYHAVQIAGEAGATGVRLHRLRLIDSGEQLVKGSTAGPPGPYADEGVVECSWLGYTDRARSWYTNGVDVLAGKDWIIRDNVFQNIRAPIGQLAGPAVLMWRNSVDTLVERNWILECDRGIALGLDAPDPRYARDGEPTFDHTRGIARNNVIWRPAGSAGDTGISVGYASDFAILHNTVLLNGTYSLGAIEYRFPDSDGLIAGNLTDAPVLGRDGGRAVVADNLLDAGADWFVDEPRGDLHLAAGSPAEDAVRSALYVADDVDGDSRPSSAHDAGADERPDDLTPAPLTGIFLPRL